MALGDGKYDESLQVAWREFCVRLEKAGERVFKDANPESSVQRSDGFRFITQNLAQAFELALETKDPSYPVFHPFCGPTRKLGSDSADAVYLQAWIDGNSVYRVSGTKGSARFWNLTVQGFRPDEGALHEPFGDTPEVSMPGEELVTDAEGRFELFVGGERREPNWLPTGPQSRKIFFRQFFDRWDEEPARCTIERVGMDAPPSPPTHETLIEAMCWAGDFVYDAVDYWPEFLWDRGALCDPAAINRFNGAAYRARLENGPDPERDEEDRKRGRLLTQMRWRLGPDEVLILEFDSYDDFWMLSNEGIFGNSMDYRYRSVSFTPSRTAVDPDGRVRFAMAHTDPGVANWIDTSGFSDGVLNFRSVASAHLPDLRTRVVEASKLEQFLPESTVWLGPEARIERMLERFHALKRRYLL